MPPLKFTEVLSFSSEDPNHPADNLLRPDTFRKWKCAAGTSDKQASVTLKLERLSSIHSIDIGNDGAAFVEILVAREGVDFQVLLVASSFMTPGESRNGSTMNRVRMFGPDKLNKNVAEQKWDRIKVICTQPFNKNMQYGLSFITVTASSEGTSDSTPKGIKLGSFTLKEEEESDPISIGSVFARRKETDPASPLTGAAAIRAASASAAASRAASASAASVPSASLSSEAKKTKLPNAPEMGFYQLKKTASPALERTKSPSASKSPPSDGRRERERESEKSRERDKDRKSKDADVKDEKDRDKQRRDKNHDRTKKPETDKRKDAEGTKKKHTEERKAPSSSSDSSSKRKSAPFKSLLKDVSFVMSGYQNPQRSQIRDMMLEMGARYKPDWDPSCTHLICAFTNTPKYQQVKGKGRIVTSKWIFDSHKNKIRYPCKRYALVKQSNGEESEEEMWAEELMPKEEKPKHTSNPVASESEESQEGKQGYGTYTDDEDTDDEIERVLAKQRIKEENVSVSTDENKTKTPSQSDNSTEEPPNKKVRMETNGKQSMNSTPKYNKKSREVDVKKELNGTEDTIYDDDTDIDEENTEHVTRPDTSAVPLPILGDYLKGKVFFIYGNMSADLKQLLSRYIIAFHGILEEYMTDQINFIVTEDEWDDHFDDALADNPSLQFVKPSWIWRCSDRQKMVPFQPFMVVPKE